ncbi:MAG: hypothetical protein HND47_14795 [Chloroflexi bacterium]|nr:hypothetical protein [Chloroflexota bacterium]
MYEYAAIHSLIRERLYSWTVSHHHNSPLNAHSRWSQHGRHQRIQFLLTLGLHLPQRIDLRLPQVPEAERRGQPIQISDNAPLFVKSYPKI